MNQWSLIENKKDFLTLIALKIAFQGDWNFRDMTMCKNRNSAALVVIIFSLCCVESFVFAQSKKVGPAKNRNDKYAQYPTLEFNYTSLNGYAKAIGGETIYYHSPIPQANLALLVRATDGKQYITEVKVQITHHQLQTAIGQLILYRYTYNEHAKLQIALPKEADMSKLSNDLMLHLETKENFHFLFVP